MVLNKCPWKFLLKNTWFFLLFRDNKKKSFFLPKKAQERTKKNFSFFNWLEVLFILQGFCSTKKQTICLLERFVFDKWGKKLQVYCQIVSSFEKVSVKLLLVGSFFQRKYFQQFCKPVAQKKLKLQLSIVEWTLFL